MTAERYGAFVSYGHGDAEWARALAENLERLGLHVFLDKWELVAGDLIAVRLQKGLAAADAVVFVVSAESVGRGWVDEELAAAIAAAVAKRQRLIPVLAGEVALPPFVASRLYIDFRNVDSPAAYEAKVRELAAAIRSRPSSARPALGGGIVPPPTAYRAEGPRSARLTIGGDVVVFSTKHTETRHKPAGLDAHARAVLSELAMSRARPGAGPLRAAAGTATASVHAALVQAGAELGRCFLDGVAGQALAAEVAAAAGGGAAIRLAVEVPDAGLADLPWETLVLPGQVTPLVLQDRVDLYRAAPMEHRPPAIQVRGPLRILAVIASPETGGGELLDYEAELSAIVNGVNPARRGEGAYVEVLNWGSLAAIRGALLERRYHILHISCHAQPGALLLEDATGHADRVTAERFAAQALPADRGVPLVVLAGCSTALSASAETAEALQGLARELLSRGVPAVVAMTAPVTDRYATAFAAEAYKQLAMREDPVPLAAVSDARRTVEAARRALAQEDPWAAIAEWATPVLLQAGPPLTLFHRADGMEELTAPAGPVFDPSMVVRRVGEFVGRRAELRTLLAALRGRDAGVVVHGIGGVGKSTLAAQLVDQLGPDRGLVVAVSGTATLTVDLVLEALRVRLLAHAVAEGLGDRDPLRQAAAALMDATPPWRERLELVRQVVLPRLPVLLLVDNIEDLLTENAGSRELADADLARFLAAWVQAAPQAKLVVTSRYRFTLPSGTARRLHWHHLGPLSLAETRKLIWRLPALDALPPADQQRAYAMVGGHPRTLEYLDALLRGGEAVFPDVADRLEAAIAQRGVADPQQWMADIEGELDRALAETVTLAADDVLLEALLASLQDAPPAPELLRRLAVYRRPVDETGAAWQLSSLTTAPDPPTELADRLRSIRKALRQARQAGTARSVEELGLDPAALAQYRADLREVARPPVALNAEARRALVLLASLGLVAPAADPDNIEKPGAAGLFVHRWTAAALGARTGPAEVADAHRKAAAYWRWRVAVWPQTRAADIEQLLEARFHHHGAGDLDAALNANGQVCRQLQTWGAWTTEQHLWDEALTWVPPRSAHAARIRHELGIVAEQRGAYDTAEQHYHDSLTIAEEVGNRADVALSYGQLGTLAYRRSDYNTAERHYREALATFEEIGDRASISTIYHQLGLIAEQLGDYDTAEQRYHDSLTIEEGLGNRAGAAMTHQQLGNLAYRRGDYDTAEQRYRRGLATFEEIGDRASISITYHQLGLIAEERGDYDTAEQRYHDSLTIAQEIGNRVGIANTLSRLGVLRARQDRPADAVNYQLRALAVRAELGSSVAANVRMLREQRAALGDQEFQRILHTLVDNDFAAAIMEVTKQTG